MPVKRTVTKQKPNRSESTSENARGTNSANRQAVKKVCFFCEQKKEPTYTDTQVLRRYLSDRARINPKQRSGLCSKHQRKVTLEIKYARHLSLLPFVPNL